MIKLHLSVSCILLFALALMLSACAASNAAHEQILSEQDIQPADVLDNNGYAKHDQNPEENMKQPNDNNPKNENQNGDHGQATGLDNENDTNEGVTANCEKETTSLRSESILLNFQEISVPSYQQLYGQKHFSSDQVISISERIALVTVNKNILNQEGINAGDCLLLSVFDDGQILLTIKNTYNSHNSFTISGVAEGSISSFMALSITVNQVLASIKIDDHNTFYLIKYNPISSQHYLYQSPIDKIEVVQEDNVLIPD